MDDKSASMDRLLAEYQANVALWQHDDSLRQQRNGNFLTVNAILLTAIAALSTLHVPLVHLGAMGATFGVVGITMCRVWHAVQVRNAEYVRFRRFQLRSIEERFPEVTTFANTYAAFDQGERLEFHAIHDAFEVELRARKRSALSEGALPLILGTLWGIITAVAAVLVVTHLPAWLASL